MNNDIELPDPELTKIDPSIATDAKIGNEGKIVLAIIAAVCVVICLCAMLCIGTGVLSIGGVVKERAPVKAVLETFMRDMMAKDYESAYALFSPGSQNQTSLADLRQMGAGENAVMFQDYKKLQIIDLYVNSNIYTEEPGPQGVTAIVHGKIQYQNGKDAEFAGTLEKVDGKWMLYSIDLWQGIPDFQDEDPVRDVSI